MTDIVAIDIGGTHARFAPAEVEGGRVISLGETCTLRTSDYPGLAEAWEEFCGRAGAPRASGAAIAFAGPVGGETLKLTNNEWVIRPATIAEELGLSRCRIVNDFGAVAHAVAHLPPSELRHLFGPDQPLPQEGLISIVGPGTGLGVAMLLRQSGRNHVIETEGAHTDFGPVDEVEDRILAFLRGPFGRVSVERVVSGAGLANIHEALGNRRREEKELWTDALAGSDSAAAASLERFCLSLGSAMGDLALAQGASAVVVAGGLGLRIADHLPRSGFYSRFTAKGRYRGMMEAMPIKLITHPQPGLYGAAAAFAERFSA
ncbi:MAG TPA: glucokinase [Allosphingosinicella sp.]|jgi:glucokinase